METATSYAVSQHLTFRLDRELFAIDIARVREVLEFSTATKVPRTPDFMRGVINLRGNVLPVVDLRVKLGMPTTENTVETCVVVTEVLLEGEHVVLGLLVDSVQEVLELDASHVVPPPRMGTQIDTSVIHGMGKRDDEFVIILDIDKVFTQGDLKDVVAAA